MRQVSIIGHGQLPIEKENKLSLREMGAAVVRQALVGVDPADIEALYAGNMLADELQGQKHLGALIASEAGLIGVEAMQVRAATATGAAALRMAYLAVASGEVDFAIAVGVEKMRGGIATAALAKALDAEREIPSGATMISQNAALMAHYVARYAVPADGLANFAVNAHRNALTNQNALFHKAVTKEMVVNSREIVPPIRLLDCSPICEGAAAVLLAPTTVAPTGSIKILASSGAIDRFRVLDRADPLALDAARISAERALQRANLTLKEIDFYELHDAFSIMACLQLEAVGFANAGEGWRLAADERILREGDVPIATMGGLKARGHPIGATALYQTCEIVQQLTGSAQENQIGGAEVGMLQSVGGAGTTVLTHLFGV